MQRRQLIEILLPLYDNAGNKFGEEPFARTRAELTERFGGLTAHLRAPARGLWKAPDGEITRDDIVIFEVMADSLDAEWWGRYRTTLEERFRQDAIVIRAAAVTVV